MSVGLSVGAIALSGWVTVAAQGQGDRALEGAWHLTVAIDGVPGSEHSHLGTFNRDGSYVQSSQPDESTGHGVWQWAGEDAFDLTFEALSFDQEAPAALTIKVRARATLDGSGDWLSGEFEAEVMLPDGTVVDSLTGTVEGRRIMVEPL